MQQRMHEGYRRLASHRRFRALVSPDGSRRQQWVRQAVNRVRHRTGERRFPRERDMWLYDHYFSAVDEIADLLNDEGVSLAGARVADIGCGDGLTDLGVARRLVPASLIGFDIRPTDTDQLVSAAARVLRGSGLPSNLSFQQCGETSLPAADGTFDCVITWSAFEHISDPVAVLREIRRVLKPTGHLFLQLSPFYDSPKGSHLEGWYPEGFVQHRLTKEQIESHVRANPLPGRPDWHADHMLEAYDTLNRITLDDLQAALHQAGFDIRVAQLYSLRARIPAEARAVALSSLLIDGVKLVAVPSGQ